MPEARTREEELWKAILAQRGRIQKLNHESKSEIEEATTNLELLKAEYEAETGRKCEIPWFPGNGVNFPQHKVPPQSASLMHEEIHRYIRTGDLGKG